MLVICAFTFSYSLASRVFPNAKYYVVCTEFSMDSKFYFSQFIFIDKEIQGN